MEEPKDKSSAEKVEVKVTPSSKTQDASAKSGYHYENVADTAPRYSSWKVVSGGLLGLVILIALVSVIAFHKSNKTTTSSTKGAVQAIVAPSSVPPALVSVTKTGFTPANVKVVVGQAVNWTNNDSSNHFVINNTNKPIDPNAPDPNSQGAISPGNSYSYVFNKAGTYEYHDTVNPNFTGTIIVQ
jgi:plastocyanin